jgi:hypothetical protein
MIRDKPTALVFDRHVLGTLSDRQDDASALHLPALRRWNRILRVFTAEYLGLAPSTSKRRRKAQVGQVESTRAEQARKAGQGDGAGTPRTVDDLVSLWWVRVGFY